MTVTLWVRTATKEKAERVGRRVAARLDAQGDSFRVESYDEDRGLWRLVCQRGVAAVAAEGVWETLTIVGRMARRVTVAAPQRFRNGTWEIHGGTDERDLGDAGTVLLSFVAGTVLAEPSEAR